MTARKRTAEEIAKLLGHKAGEIKAVEAAHGGTVVTTSDGARMWLDENDEPHWYGYGEKPPNDRLPRFDPETETVSPPKVQTKKA